MKNRKEFGGIATAMAVALVSFGFGIEALAELLPPQIGIGWTEGWVSEWKGAIPGLEVRDSNVKVADGLEKVVRRWTWNGKVPLEKVVLSVRYRVKGEPTAIKPFMPGVLLYGNPSNCGRRDGRVAVYAGEQGEFAIFEEHRLPMPFALAENSQNGSFAVLHTLPSPIRGAVREDLWWSAGIEQTADGADLVLLSGPVGYNRRRSVVKALQGKAMEYDETYITLQPGQVVEKTFWIQTGKATAEAFGFEQAIEASLGLFRPYSTERLTPAEEIVKSKMRFARTRWREGPQEGACGFIEHDPATGLRMLVMGWCGCAATCGYALPVLSDDPADWDKAQRSLDSLCEIFGKAEREDGLYRVGFDMNTGKYSGGDPVSCGQGLYSVLKAIRMAQGKGGRLDSTKWRKFAERAATRIAERVLAEGWKEPKSTGEGFLVAPLVVASELFGREECLRAAKKIAGVFERKYFGYEAVYWGGTLDAQCEDKEGAYAAFQGYAELLRIAVKSGDRDGEKKYARLARHSMNMALSYLMVWDATYPPGRLSDHAFRSTGWTVVSPQNQHLDAFGVLMTPEIWRMGEYLGDQRLKNLARVMFRACYQLTDANGSLGEQIQQTNFAQRGDMSDVRKLRGGYSEGWTVFWLTAHFLNAAAQFAEMKVEL